ncbi:MAG: hypothetical protein MR995_06650 [Fusobacterium mortiferum]|uniref:PTS sugar transporter subunit IIA n=1 Tax=Fusobacterium mortiferum TaxID=850 RepID=UPI0022E6D850|nr:hypothetical protein [Fusobacterium mortiferum]MCI7187798.1 hypothetical protein [Fusobacterium mortiferum]MDY2800318.1 hypothetical protein [Fusobacterium mortiferum]
MQKIIVASHGYFASGIEDSIKILIGERNNIEFISAYRDSIPDSRVLKDKLRDILEKNKDNTIIMFTDIKGGSITNTAMELLPEYRNLNIISGSSLALILEYILSSEDEEELDYKELIKNCIIEAKEGMVYINELIEGGNEDDQIL